jgi:hypothetical protein
MKLIDILRSDKESVSISKSWEVGPVPNSRFPVKGKLSLGRGWKWRTVTFDALSKKFYILIKLNVEKEYYSSILGMKENGKLKVLCHHELHTTHWNWHCHLIPGDVHKTLSGVLRDNDRMRAYPRFSSKECTVEFSVEESNALSITARMYRFSHRGSLL